MICVMYFNNEKVDKTPNELFDPPSHLFKQSDSDGESSDHPPPVIIPEGGSCAAQPNEDDESIIPINGPEGAPPNIPFFDLDMLLLSLILFQLPIPTILINLILNIHVKAIKFGNANLVVYGFQFVLSDNYIKNMLQSLE